MDEYKKFEGHWSEEPHCDNKCHYNDTYLCCNYCEKVKYICKGTCDGDYKYCTRKGLSRIRKHYA